MKWQKTHRWLTKNIYKKLNNNLNSIIYNQNKMIMKNNHFYLSTLTQVEMIKNASQYMKETQPLSWLKNSARNMIQMMTPKRSQSNYLSNKWQECCQKQMKMKTTATKMKMRMMPQKINITNNEYILPIHNFNNQIYLNINCILIFTN